ncbi:isopentenyl-diphosphate Delta-isomerase [Phenylobacterium sp.]|uniref:isopentenyl-diphosphate Delta-isomerase n=1 Tax=Phenylobacterium sp. TaxID=1871053 RepID=UPI0039839EF0
MTDPGRDAQNDAAERVICVDEADNPIGEAGKLDAHERGLLHRAFSVFLFDDQNRLLLQRRAPTKYHSGGLWANSCCGHPRPEEPTLEAAVRRTREELGVAAELHESYRFRYRADLDNGLIENELVHMMFGRLAGAPAPDPAEVTSLRWMSLSSLANGVARTPLVYSPWLRLYVESGLSDLSYALADLETR